MADITPYTISVPDSKLEDLKKRLDLAVFPDELDLAAWDLGAPLQDIKRLTAYWRDEFDWRKAERSLNQLLHFSTPIQCDGFESLKIHFIHQRSNVESAIPLLWVHGWPGSFYEGIKIISSLTQASDDNAPSFHVVIPSIANFGFSEGPKTRGFAIAQHAETCHKLMLKLGYNQYVTQGGDWGFYITRAMASLYPNHVVAHHVNFDGGSQPSFLSHPYLALTHAITPYTPRETSGFARTDWFMREGSGYRTQQGTKPQTLGYGLADSPVALLAWIYEKLHDWTDNYPWTEEEVCTWVAIYWFSTAGPAASVRIYYEVTHSWEKTEPEKRFTRDNVSQWIGGSKLGLSHFPRDLRVLPSAWTRTQGRVVFEREHESGGHFAAWEKPVELVGDLRDMFGRKGGAYSVVKGKDGYDKVEARL